MISDITVSNYYNNSKTNLAVLFEYETKKQRLIVEHNDINLPPTLEVCLISNKQESLIALQILLTASHN